MFIDFHHLLHFLPHIVSLAGTVALPMVGDDTSTESAATEETTTEGTETTTEGGEGAEEGEGAEGTEGQGTQAKTEETKIDWRTVSPEVKNHLSEIAKTNPKLANTLQNAVYTSQSFMKQFPGGIKEAQGLKQEIDNAGGLEEIKNARQLNRAMQLEQEELDGKARSGDISVLDNLIEIAGDGFPKLMPNALDRWSQQDSAGYSHHIGRVMVEALRQGGVVANLNLAVRMLGLKNDAATAEGIKALQDVANWVNRVGETASKPPEKPKVDPAFQAEQERINTQKTEIFNDKFNQAFTPWRNNQIRNLLAQSAPKGRTFTDYQINTFGNRVVEEVRDILAQDEEYKQDLNRIYASRDMDALLKFTRTRTEKMLPAVVDKVYKNLFSNPVQKKTTTQAAAKTTSAGKAPVEQKIPGWTKIDASKAPQPDDIDNKLTDFKMKYNRQAILKDGRKVYWGTKVPK